MVRLVLLLLLTMFGVASVAAGATHSDKTHGFSFVTPKEFASIAIEPTERRIVALYQKETKDYTSRGTYFHSKLELLRFGERSGKVPTGAEIQGWFESRFKWEPGKARGVKIAGVKTTERTYERGDYRYLLVIIPMEDAVFAFLGTALENGFDRAKKLFSKSSRSFKRIEKRVATAATSDDPQEAFLQEQIAKLPPGWESKRSPRYLYLFNAEKKFVNVVAKQIESMRDEYEELFPSPEPIEAVSIVRVTGNEDEYHAYGGSPNTNGYWSASNRELVLFERRPQEMTLETLNHEAFHQYIYYQAGELAPHSWYNEGHGDYFGGAKMSRSYRVTGYGPRRYTQRHPVVKEARRLTKAGKSTDEGGLIPLQTLCGWTQRQFYGSQRSLAYAQGWALVFWLRESKKKLDPKHAKILPSYLGHLLDARFAVAETTMAEARAAADRRIQGASKEMSSDPTDYFDDINRDTVQQLAFEKTFGGWKGEDWAAFEDAFGSFVDSL